MKKALTKTQSLYYVVNGLRVEGPHSDLRGDCSGLSGNCSDLSGNCSGLGGDCSGLGGDLDECEITEEERATGIDVEELVS